MSSPSPPEPRDLPVDRIVPHPRNSNVMADAALAALRRHIKRSGRYEPLVVRPHASDAEGPLWQVLNGHHRLRVLKDLGHQTVRCEVWDIDDREGLLLLATLNRLEGRDDPMRRAALLSDLAGEEDPSRLSRLLPEDTAALRNALALAREPLPKPVETPAADAPFLPMTFFLSGAEKATVNRALRAAETPEHDGPQRGRIRAEALVTLAESYLGAAPKAAGEGAA